MSSTRLTATPDAGTRLIRRTFAAVATLGFSSAGVLIYTFLR